MHRIFQTEDGKELNYNTQIQDSRATGVLSRTVTS